MPTWTQDLIVALLVGLCALLLVRRLIGSFGRKPRCGCDACPAKAPAKR